MVQEIDIVSFDNPFPPVYGGAIDVFYRVQALHKLGVKTRLHCYTVPERPPSPELESLCESVDYYPRTSGILPALARRPYVAATRNSASLLSNLADREGPVVFEGLHTCAICTAREIKHRPRYIRMHNVEWEYYRALADTANGSLRKLHFRRESAKLRRFEREILKSVDGVFAISHSDLDYFSSRHENVNLIPAFHQYSGVEVQMGEGEYVLFQGDLTVDDNFNVIRDLAHRIADDGIPVKVAGRINAQPSIVDAFKHENLTLYPDVSTDEMTELMLKAQVHVIDSNITSGFKLKLIAALHTARHVVARRVLVSKDLRNVVNTYSDRAELGQIVRPLMQRPVGPEDISVRRKLIEPMFSNQKNALKVMEIISTHE